MYPNETMMAYYGLIYPRISNGVALQGGGSNQNLSFFRPEKLAVKIVALLQYRVVQARVQTLKSFDIGNLASTF